MLLDTECEDLGHTLETNLIGPFRLTKAFAGAMLIRGHGTVLNISSDAAVSAYPNWGAYGISKAALDHLTRIWAEELAGTGVRFLSIDPGEMDTKMHQDALPDSDRSTLKKPSQVADQIITHLSDVEKVRSGSRLLASELGNMLSDAPEPRNIPSDAPELRKTLSTEKGLNDTSGSSA